VALAEKIAGISLQVSGDQLEGGGDVVGRMLEPGQKFFSALYGMTGRLGGSRNRLSWPTTSSLLAHWSNHRYQQFGP